MWWGIGFGVGGLLYLVLLIFLGLATLRHRHLLLFILGFFFPLLWLIGALIRPRTIVVEER